MNVKASKTIYDFKIFMECILKMKFRKTELGRYVFDFTNFCYYYIFFFFSVKLPQALSSLPKYCQMPLYRTHERHGERENTTSTTQHYKIGESRAHQLEASAAALATTTTAAAVHSEEAKEIILQFHEKKEPKILYCSFTKKKEIIEVIVLSATRYYIFEMI